MCVCVWLRESDDAAVADFVAWYQRDKRAWRNCRDSTRLRVWRLDRRHRQSSPPRARVSSPFAPPVHVEVPEVPLAGLANQPMGDVHGSPSAALRRLYSGSYESRHVDLAFVAAARWMACWRALGEGTAAAAADAGWTVNEDAGRTLQERGKLTPALPTPCRATDVRGTETNAGGGGTWAAFAAEPTVGQAVPSHEASTPP